MEEKKMRQAIIFALILVLLSGLGFAACPSGMVSYWTFDNDSVSGSTVQDIYGSNDGTNYGSTAGADGMVGEAFDFDGNDDYISLSNSNTDLKITGDITISAWINANNTEGAYIRRGSLASYANQIYNSRVSMFYYGAGCSSVKGVVKSSSSVSDGSWHNIVYTKHGNNLKMYIDGTLENSTLASEATSCGNSASVFIGAGTSNNNNPDFYLESSIDEVAIFNRALNATEVAQLYNQSSQGYDYCGTYKNTLPLSTKFTEFESTTNFSQVQNLSAVENLTLGSPHGTISFGNNTVNAENQDYNKNVVFGDCFVAVNATALDYTFNATAYLLMNNSDGHCGDDTIFVTSQVVADAGAIKTGAKICTDCKTVTIGGDTITFRVPHFSSYAIGSNSNITIDADDPKLVNQTVTFTAVYRNSSSGDFISSANCQIDLPTGSYAMNEGTQQYIYQTSFTENQTYSYNVTCSKTGYNTLLVEDSFQILPAGEAVPEFSSLLLVGLAVACLIIIIKKKRGNK